MIDVMMMISANDWFVFVVILLDREGFRNVPGGDEEWAGMALLK